MVSFDSALKKDDNNYREVFLKTCKYVEKKVVRHIHDNLRDFFYPSGESKLLLKNKLELVRFVLEKI